MSLRKGCLDISREYLELQWRFIFLKWGGGPKSSHSIKFLPPLPILPRWASEFYCELTPEATARAKCQSTTGPPRRGSHSLWQSFCLKVCCYDFSWVRCGSLLASHLNSFDPSSWESHSEVCEHPYGNTSKAKTIAEEKGSKNSPTNAIGRWSHERKDHFFDLGCGAVVLCV